MFRLALAALAVSQLASGVELKSVGALAFGPQGLLLIGDSVGGAAAIFNAPGLVDSIWVIGQRQHTRHRQF